MNWKFKKSLDKVESRHDLEFRAIFVKQNADFHEK